MEKKEYIIPRLRVVDARSRYGLLQIVVSNGPVTDGNNIGFSKDTNLDNEDIDDGSNVWED